MYEVIMPPKSHKKPKPFQNQKKHRKPSRAEGINEILKAIPITNSLILEERLLVSLS
jgi:hypothetical protein